MAPSFSSRASFSAKCSAKSSAKRSVKSSVTFSAAVVFLAALLGAGNSSTLAQSDPLVAKGILRVVSDDRFVWAFADSGASHSVIDLAQDPPAISSYKDGLPFVADGVGRLRSVLMRYHYQEVTDSVSVSGVLHLDRKDAVKADSLVLKRSSKAGAAAKGAPYFTDMAMWRDTLFLALGTAGFAKVALDAEDKAPVRDEASTWQGFAVGQDTLTSTLTCTWNAKECVTTSLDDLANRIGTLETVHALALDTSNADSVVLWLGTGHGLYKHVLGEKQITPVSFPGVADTAAFSVRRLVIDSKPGRLARIWAFSASRYAISLDGGQSFRLPPDRPGLTKVSELQGFNAIPEALMVGDTTFINFNLDKPGLMVFKSDTVQSNAIAQGEPTELGDILLDAADSLNLVRGEGRFTNFATVETGGRRWVIVASMGKGLFYRPLHSSNKEWLNISRQKPVKNSLGEIITYPTLFTAARPDGQPAYVNIGYRLKKDGKVTITIFNHAMEKVKTVVSNAPRKGAGARSENPLEDRWDGRDSNGRLVSVGTYYVRVESSSGDGGWGKILAVAGRQ